MSYRKATVKGKARVEPRVVRVAAKFANGGGSLDRRRGDTVKASGWVSDAGNLAVPDCRNKFSVAAETGGKATGCKAREKTVEEKLG